MSSKHPNDTFQTFYLVWTKPSGDVLGSHRTPTKSFTDPEKAYAAASNLAEKNPGTKFFVLEAVGRVIKLVPQKTAEMPTDGQSDVSDTV